jgi:pyridoxine 5'-phosphate synthase PdxJ
MHAEGAKETGTDRIELYTEPYAENHFGKIVNWLLKILS